MNRTAYHRAYYYAHLDRRRASARTSRRKAREVRAIIKIVCEAVTDARNDKPPFGGLTRAGGWPYSQDACWSDAKIDRGKRSVNGHPKCSGTLVGETTHRVTLNLDRGSQPLGTRRIVGKREWQRGNP